MTRLLALVVTTLLAFVQADGDCTGPSETLTWECGGVCDDYIPCLVYNASDCEASSAEHSASCTSDNETVCAYTCFTNFYSSGEVNFLIPFADGSSSDETIPSGDLEGYAWVYDDAITSVSAANLNPAVSEVYIQGGSTSYGGSRQAAVIFDSDFLVNNDVVTTVMFNYVNLSQTSDLLSILPENVTVLDSEFSSIESFDIGTSHGGKLQSLYVHIPDSSSLFPFTNSLCVMFSI